MVAPVELLPQLVGRVVEDRVDPLARDDPVAARDLGVELTRAPAGIARVHAQVLGGVGIPGAIEQDRGIDGDEQVAGDADRALGRGSGAQQHEHRPALDRPAEIDRARTVDRALDEVVQGEVGAVVDDQADRAVRRHSCKSSTTECWKNEPRTCSVATRKRPVAGRSASGCGVARLGRRPAAPSSIATPIANPTNATARGALRRRIAGGRASHAREGITRARCAAPFELHARDHRQVIRRAARGARVVRFDRDQVQAARVDPVEREHRARGRKRGRPLVVVVLVELIERERRLALPPRVHVAHQERRRLMEPRVIEQRLHLAVARAVGEREVRGDDVELGVVAS